MILIAHRGNMDGPNPPQENDPSYILHTLECGFHVEIDLWIKDNILYLGHDYPQYKIEPDFLKNEKLWIHCKNMDALTYCKENNIQTNYFWHDQDDCTLTSKGWFWTFPGKQLTPYSIAVMPETKSFENIDIAKGICTDYVNRYHNQKSSFTM